MVGEGERGQCVDNIVDCRLLYWMLWLIYLIIGHILEILLTKVLYLAHHVQIIGNQPLYIACAQSRDKQCHFYVLGTGMSATVGNLEEMCSWLRSGLYSTSFRPVPLLQMVQQIFQENSLFSGKTQCALFSLPLSMSHQQVKIGRRLFDERGKVWITTLRSKISRISY